MLNWESIVEHFESSIMEEIVTVTFDDKVQLKDALRAFHELCTGLVVLKDHAVADPVLGQSEYDNAHLLAVIQGWKASLNAILKRFLTDRSMQSRACQSACGFVARGIHGCFMQCVKQGLSLRSDVIPSIVSLRKLLHVTVQCKAAAAIASRGVDLAEATDLARQDLIKAIKEMSARMRRPKLGLAVCDSRLPFDASDSDQMTEVIVMCMDLELANQSGDSKLEKERRRMQQLVLAAAARLAESQQGMEEKRAKLEQTEKEGQVLRQHQAENLANLAYHELLREDTAQKLASERSEARQVQRQQRKAEAAALAPVRKYILGAAWSPEVHTRMLRCLQADPDTAREIHQLLMLACCPITKVLLEDAVVLADGWTYELKAAQDWLANNNVSFRTGEELLDKRIVSMALASSIVDNVKHIIQDKLETF